MRKKNNVYIQAHRNKTHLKTEEKNNPKMMFLSSTLPLESRFNSRT